MRMSDSGPYFPSTAPAVTAGGMGLSRTPFLLAESAAVTHREITPYVCIISTYKRLQLPSSCLRFYNGSPLSLRASPSAWAYFSRSCDNRPHLSYAGAFFFSFFFFNKQLSRPDILLQPARVIMEGVERSPELEGLVQTPALPQL